jgi:hypothetical protein
VAASSFASNSLDVIALDYRLHETKTTDPNVKEFNYDSSSYLLYALVDVSTQSFWGSLARLHKEQGSTPSFPSLNINHYRHNGASDHDGCYADDNDGKCI